MFWIKDSIDEVAEEIKKDISENEPKIEQWLRDHWYNIISKDTRTFFYCYRVIKWNKLETKKEFSFNELKTIISLPKTNDE